MSKLQFINNIIFFIPLLILNFFIYGFDGCILFIKEMRKYQNKYLG